VTKKRLSVVGPGDAKLGRPTIMDRALATRYGATYVHLAAFAIDIDRVREREGDESTLPFGWEVLLTERYLQQLFDGARSDPTPLIEDACLAVMDMPRPKPGQLPPLGSQLPFAVYLGVAREHLPAALGQCFRSWKKPPVDLLEELAPLEAEPAAVARLAEHCLDVALEPPLVGPVREALVTLAG
jgi:hypothetical protein